MPYFKNKDINVLFIHIPKTGGTSVDTYFSEKYNISEKNIPKEDLYNYGIIEKKKYPLQHMTLNEIMKNKELFNITLKNIKILSIVRNPYYRIISELIYNHKMTIDYTKTQVYDKILELFKEYELNNTIYDNHIKPQYLFLDNFFIKNIIILHTESLKEDMHKNGYTDFKLHANKAHFDNIDYMSYLNDNSIRLINIFYRKDFIKFNYTMIDV
jgi:hypothetical protein